MKHQLFQSTASALTSGYRFKKFKGKFYITDGIEADSLQYRLLIEDYVHCENLNALPPKVQPLRYTHYSPLESRDEKTNSALFLTFALLDNSEESILGFANKYGLLLSQKILYEGYNFITLESGKVMFAEPVEVWERNIIEMRFMVELWTAIKREDKKLLSESIQVFTEVWKSQTRTTELTFLMAQTKDFAFEIGSTEFEPKKLRSDICCAALVLIGRFIQMRLDSKDTGAFSYENKPGEKVQHIFERPDSAISSVTMVWNPEWNRPAVVIRPTSLLASMWLTFARTVGGNIEHRKCLVCPTLFEISVDPVAGSRSDKKTCSDRCRSRLSRQNSKI